MSTTTTSGVDARGYLTGWLQALTGMTIADIQAIPDDKWNATHGGCSKPASAALADIVTNLKWTTATIKGEESSAYNEMAGLAAKMSDKGAAIAALKEAADEFSVALKEASDERLNETVMAPWNLPTPVFMLAHISVSHVWYHDGQFNYIQTLLGDDKVHWMM